MCACECVCVCLKRWYTLTLTHFHFFLFFSLTSNWFELYFKRVTLQKEHEWDGWKAEWGGRGFNARWHMSEAAFVRNTHTSAKLLEAFPLDADGGAQYPDAYAISYQVVPLHCPCLCMLDCFILTPHGKFREDWGLSVLERESISSHHPPVLFFSQSFSGLLSFLPFSPYLCCVFPRWHRETRVDPAGRRFRQTALSLPLCVCPRLSFSLKTDKPCTHIICL